MGARSVVMAALLALAVGVAALVLVIIVWVDKDWVNSRVDESGESAGSASAGQSGGSGGVQRQQETYVFGIENTLQPPNQLNAEGRLTGLTIDLIMAICADQMKQCSAMHVHDANLCWNSVDNIGIGIVARYFVGCIPWFHTQARDNVFSFSSPLYDNGQGTTNVIFKAGAGYTSIGNRTIGFVESSYTDPACLHRAGQSLQESQIKYTLNNQELKDMLDRGEIDFAFATQGSGTLFSDLTQYEVLDIAPTCQLAGAGLMTSKSQRELLLWFNRGLQNIRQNGVYRDLCRVANERYGAGASDECF